MGIYLQFGKGCGLMKSFSAFHPTSLFVYFTCVIFINMFVNNPVIYLISLIGSLSLYAFQSERKFLHDLAFYIAAFILIALANPLFSHNGITVLFFLNGNPITYEAIIYGVAISAMIVATLFWFKSFNIIMTSDKLLYLFGRVIPKLSIVLSSALRYIPIFRRQTEKIKKSQTAMGLYSKDNYIDNAKGTLRVFSIMVTWSLENAIDTADSMKARGYGLHGRTQFSIFHFRISDLLLIVTSVFLSAITISGIALGYVDFTFYPRISMALTSQYSYVVYASYATLAILPFIYEIKENIRWIYCKSKT